MSTHFICNAETKNPWSNPILALAVVGLDQTRIDGIPLTHWGQLLLITAAAVIFLNLGGLRVQIWEYRFVNQARVSKSTCKTSKVHGIRSLLKIIKKSFLFFKYWRRHIICVLLNEKEWLHECKMSKYRLLWIIHYLCRSWVMKSRAITLLSFNNHLQPYGKYLKPYMDLTTDRWLRNSVQLGLRPCPRCKREQFIRHGQVYSSN